MNMPRNLLLVCIGILFVTVSSCAPPSTDNAPRQPRIIYQAPPHPIHDFFLKDGVRCVYVNGVREGGLSCDFNANRKRAE